ncbi:cysteine hydrolase family protein [Massilimicrobiota timonensis]|uniref:cysteine hydrolase family protein n=1 Tax=Massilimicrobiota timonensis TaxID=1776392 RepID=UPI001961465B|nr:isochorismatase family cysteine hydrolase [Massilimicrobiota timonensis]MBM6966516.1 cysteine hydrolase [Massilimicrobiota timonensis]
MKKTIIVVDMQNDFVTGSLGTKEACKTVPVIEKLLKENQGNQIIFTQDTHHEDYLSTSEGKMLPVEHCMKGTMGWEIIPELKEWTHQAIMVEKPTFGSLKLPQLISQNQPEQIILVGVCSDICVISNALILKAYFPETPIIVYENACAGVTPDKHQAAIETMKSCQIDVQTYL